MDQLCADSANRQSCAQGGVFWGRGFVKAGGLFAAGWSPEDGPGGEVRGEVDEAVVLAGGDEEDVAGDEGEERGFLSSDLEGAGAFHDDVELALCMGGLVVAASGSEDEDGHGAVGEDGLVPDALRPGGGCWEGKRRERGFEVDAHVGIFASRVLPVRASFNPPIPAMRPPVWMGHPALNNNKAADSFDARLFRRSRRGDGPRVTRGIIQHSHISSRCGAHRGIIRRKVGDK